MSKIYRLACVLVLAVLVAVVADSRTASAQRFSIGGIRIRAATANNDNDNDDDDDDKIDNDQQQRRTTIAIESTSNNRKRSNNSSSSSRAGRMARTRTARAGRFESVPPLESAGTDSRPAIPRSAAIPELAARRPEAASRSAPGNAGKWQGSHEIEKWTQAFGGNQQPFSSQWYQDHPEGLEVRQQQGERVGRRHAARRLLLARLGQRAAAIQRRLRQRAAVRPVATTANGIRSASTR